MQSIRILLGLCLILGTICLIKGQTGGGLIIVAPSPAVVTPASSNPTCQCTVPSNCADLATALDPRILFNPGTPPCPTGTRICCNLIIPNPVTVSPPNPLNCGTQPLIPFPTYTVAFGQASYTEYPWMALILGSDNSYIGGGVLIDGNTVLTAAHKVSALTLSIKVRLGEFILNSDIEPNRNIEIPVSAVRINPSFTASNLNNDIAVLKLAFAVDFVAYPNIRPICLPLATAAYTGQRCFVSGWGASAFIGGTYSSTMKEVDLPIIDPVTCQTMFGTTRLGPAFVLNAQSFVCAGGEAGKDACTGDGGSPLVCFTGTQWILAGLVSWGIGCGAAGVPGAYVNIPNFIPWITANRF